MLKEIYLVDAVRTPIGKFGGSLKDIAASELGLITANALFDRNNLNAKDVDTLVFGNVSSTGDVSNAARHISIKTGMRDDCSAFSVNRLCGSGLQAIVSSLLEMETGHSDIAMSVGAENMSSMPYYLPEARWGKKMGHFKTMDSMGDILSDPIEKYPAGMLGENLVEKFEISRDAQDKFALSSQDKYFIADQEGRFDSQLISVDAGKRIGLFTKDEYPRKTTLENLAKLRPVFKKDGSVTAGNASGINDGGAAALFATKEKMMSLDLKPLAKVKAYAWSGVNHHLMGYAPVESSKKALKLAGLTMKDINLIEINEAFASQVLAVEKGLNWDPSIVNVNGGAISLGHPLGMSGVRITTMLAHEMKRQNLELGLATICIGGGMGITLILENV